MSTGAECYFYEEKPHKWYYKLQRWPYGEWPEFDRYGAFPTFKAALDHLDKHHANPGGYSVNPLDGCPHDLIRQREGDKLYPTHIEQEVADWYRNNGEEIFEDWKEKQSDKTT